MYLLNLTWFQLAVLFGTTSAGVLALYLWDRSRRRVRVPTLRFWTASQRAAEVKHRRRLQQPWSLILQLLSMLLLLLALAQLRLGAPGPVSRDHVLILDTSAWMGAHAGRRLLMDQARAAAKAYIHAVSPADRVMLVRADALATPATAFERNRAALESAIDESRPGFTALNLGQALEFARQALKLQGGRSGEIVYVGPGRISDSAAELRPPPNMRVLPIAADVENCGLKKIGLRRSAADPDLWEILVGVHNYGTKPRALTLALAFGGSPVGTRRLAVAPGMDQNATFQYRTRVAGWLEARLLPPDDFPGNDRAVVEVPGRPALKVLVYSEQPELLRPVLAASPNVQPQFRTPAQYRADANAEIVIFDRFSPPEPPQTDAIWIEPPAQDSPLPVRSTANNVKLTAWRPDHPLGAGLRTKDLHLDATEIFQTAPGDIAVAETEAGPAIVARAGKHKSVALGFHPVRTAMRYELTTPLLFANILRWMAPDIFRRWELNAGSVGTVDVTLGSDVDSSAVRVEADNGTPLPYTLQGRDLRFFAGTPGTVRVVTGEGEMVYSLILPEVAETRWNPPRSLRRGLPATAATVVGYAELWHWLALAGALGLLVEWLLFGRWRRFVPPRRQTPKSALAGSQPGGAL